MSELQKYRMQIDAIDVQIIELLAQRFEVVKKVWEYKKKNNLPPLQPERWREVLHARKEKGAELWIQGECIENIWNEIHKEALKIEE